MAGFFRTCTDISLAGICGISLISAISVQISGDTSNPTIWPSVQKAMTTLKIMSTPNPELESRSYKDVRGAWTEEGAKIIGKNINFSLDPRLAGVDACADNRSGDEEVWTVDRATANEVFDRWSSGDARVLNGGLLAITNLLGSEPNLIACRNDGVDEHHWFVGDERAVLIGTQTDESIKLAKKSWDSAYPSNSTTSQSNGLYRDASRPRIDYDNVPLTSEDL